MNVLVGCNVLFHNESFGIAVDAHVFVVVVVLVFVAEFFMDFVNEQLVNDAATKRIANHFSTFVVLGMIVFVAQSAGNRRAVRNLVLGDAMLHAPIFDELLPSELSFFRRCFRRCIVVIFEITNQIR